VILSYDCLGLL
jgi:hypothetical protein